ncbi:MAG: LacI family transcriptional regulator [Alphaproteobacteria bacterium]|nr:LacI family transcriptional regulator [Alphaproteobacteria bacterium]
MTAQISRARAVTLRDVAEVAGTTPMTVSNVVNGRTGEVGRETYERVMAACTRLGYRPHAAARRLRTNRRMAVGIVIVDPSPNYLADPFTAAMLAGLNAHLGSRSYSLVIHGASPSGLGSVPLLQRLETDAICVMLSGAAGARREILKQVAALGQPVVVVQDALPDDVADGCSLIQDDFGGGVQLARHLFDARAKQVALLVPKAEWPAMERREAGIRSVIERLARPPALRTVYCGDESFDHTQRALERHMTAHGMPDVIIGGNDQMAIAAMKFATSHNSRVPEDVRVTGFNGLAIWRYATPELTTVFSPAYELGEAAGKAILSRLESGSFPSRVRSLPVRFAPNRSSAG